MSEIPVITVKINPSDINVKNSFSGSRWKNLETEIAAKWLCKFARQRGNWDPFRKEEIDEFCKHDFHFNYLTYSSILEVRYITNATIVNCEPYMKNGVMYVLRVEKEYRSLYYFTNEFIQECFNLTRTK